MNLNKLLPKMRWIKTPAGYDRGMLWLPMAYVQYDSNPAYWGNKAMVKQESIALGPFLIVWLDDETKEKKCSKT